MRWHEYHLEPTVEKCAIEVSRRQDSSYYRSPRLIRLYIAFSTVSKFFVHQRTLTERVDVQPYIFPVGVIRLHTPREVQVQRKFLAYMYVGCRIFRSLLPIGKRQLARLCGSKTRLLPVFSHCSTQRKCNVTIAGYVLLMLANKHHRDAD